MRLMFVDWSTQYKRIIGDSQLLDVGQGVAVTTTPSIDGHGDGELTIHGNVLACNECQ